MRAGRGLGNRAAMNAPEEQEGISGKAYDLKLALRLWRFLRPHRKIFFLSLLLLPVHQGFNLAQPLLLKIGIDAVSAGDGLTLMTTGLLFAGALAAEAAAYFFQYYLSMKVAQRCLADLRVENLLSRAAPAHELLRPQPGGPAHDPHDHGRGGCCRRCSPPAP